MFTIMKHLASKAETCRWFGPLQLLVSRESHSYGSLSKAAASAQRSTFDNKASLDHKCILVLFSIWPSRSLLRHTYQEILRFSNVEQRAAKHHSKQSFFLKMGSIRQQNKVTWTESDKCLKMKVNGRNTGVDIFVVYSRGRKCWRWCDLGEKNICWFKCFYTIF